MELALCEVIIELLLCFLLKFIVVYLNCPKRTGMCLIVDCITPVNFYAMFYFLFSDSGKLVGSDLPLRRLMSSSGHHFLHAFLLHRDEIILGYRYILYVFLPLV